MVTGIYAKKLVRTLGFVLLFAIIIGYGVWRSRDILFGINLTVAGIQNGMETKEPLLSFSGTAKHVSNLAVNGQTIAAAEDGSWQDTIALLPGYNVITISATDKFDRTIKKTYQVFYVVEKIPLQPVLETPETEETPAETPV